MDDLRLWVRDVCAGRSVPSEWRPALSRPVSAYALSHGAILGVGLVQLALAFAPRPYLRSRRLQAAEAVLIVLAAVVSYLADVVYVCRPSAVHGIDLALATLLVALLVCKVATLRSVRVLGMLALVAALGFRALSRRAALRGDLRQFRAAHAAWHVTIPAFAILFFLFR